jgi:DNA-binding winged helix-turn-helix (wHTH) protein
MVNVSDSPILGLPEVVVDRINRVLIGPEGTRVQLPYLSVRLLEALAASSPGFVSSNALLGRVWPDTHIGPDALKQRVRLLRVSLTDAGYDARLLDSVRGEGYALRARLMDAPPAMAEIPVPMLAPGLADQRDGSSSTEGKATVAAVRRMVLAALLLLVSAAVVTLAYRSGTERPSGTSAAAALGPAPVRLGIAAHPNDTVAAQLMDVLGSTPNLLLVPVALPVAPDGADGCRATDLMHLCLSAMPSADGYTLTVTQRRTGAMINRETLDPSRASIALAAFRIAQFATPAVLRWLGGSGQGDVAFDHFRSAVRALQQCDTVFRSESLADLRLTAAQSPNFLPARALLAALSVDAAEAANDTGEITRATTEASAVLTRMPDLPLAHLAIARGAALRGDTVAGRVAMTRAVRLLPVLERFYDESARPRAPSRCAGQASL